MTPQERQMIDDLFDRLARLESAPRDPEAEALIAQAWQRAPNASYALVQTVLVQDEALKRAHERIERTPESAQREVERERDERSLRVVAHDRIGRVFVLTVVLDPGVEARLRDALHQAARTVQHRRDRAAE